MTWYKRKQYADEDVKSGGDIAIESGATLDIESGGAFKIAGTDVTSSAAELNALDGIPGGTVAFAVAGGAQNVAEVTCTVKDAAGVAMTRPILCHVWLSDSAAGEGLAAQPDAIAVKAAGGTSIAVLTANKAILAQTTAAGVLVIQVTDAAQTAMKICVQPLGCSIPSIGSIATGDYTD